MVKPRLKSAEDLREHGFADNAIARVAARYAVGITSQVIRTIKGGVESDPVARQYVPQIDELKILPQENTDPIGDSAHTPVKGIVHRYTDRVLFKIAHVCAVYCRFCFRREMVGPQTKNGLSPEERKAAINYIRNNKNIWEVILTGGDPLVLSPRQLKETLDEIEAIDHVRVIRVHTRIPVADPLRITAELCESLTRTKAVYIAVHINHAQEITPEVEQAFRKLQKADCVLLSQSVLLKGVNDDPAVLETLFRRLTALRVKPYYLHHPDLAPGTGHFRLSIRRGREIMKGLLNLSGIARPHYMLDIPGGYGKVPVEACYAVESADGSWQIEDPQGKVHTYRDGE